MAAVLAFGVDQLDILTSSGTTGKIDGPHSLV